MKCKLVNENTELGLVAGEEGFGIETGSQNGVGYSILFPANHTHNPIMLFFLKENPSNEIEVTDGSSAGENAYYSI